VQAYSPQQRQFPLACTFVVALFFCFRVPLRLPPIAGRFHPQAQQRSRPSRGRPDDIHRSLHFLEVYGWSVQRSALLAHKMLWCVESVAVGLGLQGDRASVRDEVKGMGPPVLTFPRWDVCSCSRCLSRPEHSLRACAATRNHCSAAQIVRLGTPEGMVSCVGWISKKSPLCRSIT
jgi:hypothetical protein